jgi:bifunctional N-acetylglucosamine-1-phosphate-uridyltransferase/glucosamine-1-phosphate-acetyltransferase GlmU-like protein
VKKILIVVGKYKNEIKEVIDKEFIKTPINCLRYVDQPEAKGTGHAIQCCIPELSEYPSANVLILSGDVPLLSNKTMYDTLNNKSGVRIVVTNFKDPTGYGRIYMKNDKFERIIEQKDCNAEEVKIKLVNCGIYAVKSRLLCQYLPLLKNNNSQNEYYLTDVIEIIKNNENVDIDLLIVEESNQYEIIGVNTIEQLKELEELYQSRINYMNFLIHK